MNEIQFFGDYEVLEWLGERSTRKVYDFITGDLDGALKQEGSIFKFDGDNLSIFSDKEYVINIGDYIAREKLNRYDNVPKKIFKVCGNKLKNFFGEISS